MCCIRSTVFVWLGLVVAVCAQETPQNGNANSKRITVDGSTLLVDEKPFFPRIVQHNGESFKFLRSIGFNTVQLSGPAQQQQLREAAAAGIWVICPPPSYLGAGSISSLYDSVLAWSLGNGLTENQLQLTRAQITDIKDADPKARPVFVHANSHWRSYSQVTSILGVGKPTIGTSAPLSDYDQWIASATGNPIQPIWVDIQTQLPKALARQIETLVGSKPPIPIQHQQIRFQMYEAIASGSRGMRFLSADRLDGNDPETRLRVLSLRWALGHAEQLAPWIAGGLIRQKDSLSTADRTVFTLALPGSQILFIQRKTGFEQWVCGDVPIQPIDFASVSSSSSDRFYRINELGATLIQDRSAIPGTRIKIDRAGCANTVLITADPVAVSQINSQLSGVPVGLEQRRQLVQQSLAYAQLVEQSLAATGIGFPFVGGAREQAVKDLGNAEPMITRGDYPVALQYLEKADMNIASIGRQLIEQQRKSGDGLYSSPFLVHVGLIPLHLQTAKRFAGSQWNPNALTAGDFENLKQMMTAGWKNRRSNQSGFTTRVELEKTAAVQGTYGLKMTVVDSNQIGRPDAAPLWIQSAPVNVKQGQLIRIGGYVNVTAQGPDVVPFEIMDSIAGHSLAVSVSASASWQPFTIYRVATRDGELKLTFSLNAAGSAMIDEVTVRTLDPQRPDEQALNSSDIK